MCLQWDILYVLQMCYKKNLYCVCCVKKGKLEPPFLSQNYLKCCCRPTFAETDGNFPLQFDSSHPLLFSRLIFSVLHKKATTQKQHSQLILHSFYTRNIFCTNTFVSCLRSNIPFAAFFSGSQEEWLFSGSLSNGEHTN